MMSDALVELRNNNNLLAELCLDNRIGTPSWNILLEKNDKLVKRLLKEAKRNIKLRKRLEKEKVGQK